MLQCYPAKIQEPYVGPADLRSGLLPVHLRLQARVDYHESRRVREEMLRTKPKVLTR